MTESPESDAPETRENRDLWDAWSDAFQAAWRADTDEGELPPAGVFLGPDVHDDETRAEVLPDLDGLDAVELGCGGGQGTVGLALEGANATGVDFSTGQLRWARELRAAYEVEADFVAGDVTDLPLADDQFDLAVPHPFYETFDADERELDWSYFDRGPERNPIGEYDPDMLVYHHTVGDYHEALTNAGFTVERLLEPGSSDPDVYEEQWSHKPDLMAMVPPALVVKARG
jgi:SAM-dependent methyltransferase